jgi:Xaa-Pro aminopeptidase
MPADIAAKLAGLRSLLKAHSLGAYIIPSGDAHSSEYVSETDKRREWLTGFTGSAGIALVTADKALVWTDGRYFTQAAQQLAGTEWELMRMNEPGVPELEEWVKTHQASLGGPIGADPRLVTLDFAAEWQQKGCAELALVAEHLVEPLSPA